MVGGSAAADYETELAEWVATTYDNPLAFVLGAYPWGEPGPLQDYDGPDDWQREQLVSIGEQVKKHKFDGVTPVPPVREASSSGHGVGKTTEVGWIVDWIMSTRPGAQGSVTANTM